MSRVELQMLLPGKRIEAFVGVRENVHAVNAEVE